MTEISNEERQLNTLSDTSEDIESSTKLTTTKADISHSGFIPLKPYKIGNLYTFCYVKNIPLIVIGPHCK